MSIVSTAEELEALVELGMDLLSPWMIFTTMYTDLWYAEIVFIVLPETGSNWMWISVNQPLKEYHLTSQNYNKNKNKDEN